MEQAFWLVWNPEGGPPSHRHRTQEGAVEEAKRLARNNPGREFIVLEAVGSARKVDVEFRGFARPLPF